MNELMNNQLTISSREVAEMMEVRHKHLLEKIDKINETLTSRKIDPLKYWKISSYIDLKGEERREFQITKRGCDFLANKSTGEKGIIFTDRYMDKFEEMKNTLEQLNLPSYQIENPIERAKRWIQEEEERQRLLEETKNLIKEITHKEDVIIGLVEDIDLATKRQRITQIIRHNANGKFQERYKLLYGEFEKKYHIDLSRRIKNCDIKPKIKNKIDYIERVLKMIPELYEIACKMFESDIEELIQEWRDTINK